MEFFRGLAVAFIVTLTLALLGASLWLWLHSAV